MKAYVCNSCGAELLLNDEATFTTCLYCGNNIAITTKEISDLNIKKIIPFTIDKEEAIQNFGYLLRDKIIDAKKVYVPVRFCSFDFDYLMFFEYCETDSDGDTTYHNSEDLLDGIVKENILFGKSKVNEIYYENELRNQERLDFDPILLKDVSIEYTELLSSDEIRAKIERELNAYCKFKMSRSITKIYSKNFFISNLNIDPFTTLIPVYIIKTANGFIYNIPGIKIDVTSERMKFRRRVIGFILFFIILTIFLYNVIHSNNDGLYESSMGDSYLFIAILIPMIFLLGRLYARRPKIKTDRFTNYSYKRYEFGSKRKKIK